MSLGIEEQFYLIWPMLLWGASRLRLPFLWAISFILALSFILNVTFIHSDSVLTFYAPYTRIWELAIGGLLAALVHKQNSLFSKINRNMSDSLVLIGLGLIAFCVFFLSESDPFPGWYALLPVTAATLLILTGHRSRLGRLLLSNKIAVWFGLISFPLYLWHWPILSFGSIYEGGDSLTREFKVVAILSSIALSWLTVKLVENNIRFRKGYRAVHLLLLAALGLLIAALCIYQSDGLPNRPAVTNSNFSPEVRHQFAGPAWSYATNKHCLESHDFEAAEDYQWWFCMKSTPRPPSLVLLGSSFANQLYPGFAQNAALAHHSVLSIGACDLDATGLESKNPRSPCYGEARIQEQALFIDKLLAETPSIRFVVIDGINRNADEVHMERLLDRIAFIRAQGVRIIIFTPHIKPKFHPKTCFSTPFKQELKDCNFPEEERQALLDGFQPVIETLTEKFPDILIFEQNDVFCEGSLCSYIKEGKPLHRDIGHISEFASIKLQDDFTNWARKNLPQILDASYLLEK